MHAALPEAIECPKCGSKNTLELLYGLEPEEQYPTFEGNGFVYAGCGPSTATHQCGDCAIWWTNQR